MHPESTRRAVTSTGDPRVDQVIAGLSALADMDLDERPAVLAGAHDRLREILGELGDAGGPGHHGEQGEPGPAARTRPGSPR